MKKSILIALCLLLTTTSIFAQRKNKKMKNLPEFQLEMSDVSFPLRFLASDEMQGRNTGSEENNIAARFLAEKLRAYGFQPAPGTDDFLQTIPFQKVSTPESGDLKIGNRSLTFKEDFLWLSGDAKSIETTAVFAGYGWVAEDGSHDDYADLDVAGKVVFVLPGIPEDDSPSTVFTAGGRKKELAHERGATAVIELYRLSFPWNFFTRYFGRESLTLPTGDSEVNDAIVYGFLKEPTDDNPIAAIVEGETPEIALTSSGYQVRPVPSSNVVGVLEGADPNLKEEYVLLSAHFDHVGVGSDGGGPYTETDSIFNGTRDNGMGTVAMLMAAKVLAEEKPKRSIIVLGCTGEEKGLLGSRYYAENPLIPLDQTIFNLNNDGAGYNDTTVISIIGHGRTGTDDHIQTAVEAVGKSVFPNPAPEQNLFDRSDNVSFAAKGVPCMTFTPGITEFDAEIQKYYHQVADNPNSISYPYFLDYCKAYAHLARLIANDKDRPQWMEGDKYEEAGEQLYNR